MATSDIEVCDPRFSECIRDNERVEALFGGCRWAEGPAYSAAGRYLVWSDIPADRLLRWDETNGAVSVFRGPAGYPNGNAFDDAGRLVTCEHGNRRVSRTEHDGRVLPLVDAFDGRRLNSPNDLLVASDGAVWFTDPTYGIDSDDEGHRADSEIGGCHVYRYDPRSRECRRVIDGLSQPNGIAFSPDERRLYVSDTGVTHVAGGPRDIRVYDVADDWSLSGGERFATCTVGVFDGFCIDADGRIWASTAEGVHCFDPDRTLLGKIHLPEVASNVVFGGAGHDRLFITATTSLYAVSLPVRGAP